MIKVNNLVKIYNQNQKNEYLALDNASLEIQDGDFVSLTGPSGAGKSTLFHILSSIDNFTSGTVLIDDYNLGKASESKRAKIRNQYTSIVLQDFWLIDEYSVIENVMVPLLIQKGSTSKKKKACLDVLESVGLKNLAYKPVNQLSGGQKQRVAIARALVTNPKYIFADEPTGALDSKNTDEIFELFSSLNKKGITIMIITHDLNIAKRCNRVINIVDGKISEM